jgi:hypothetical protein
LAEAFDVLNDTGKRGRCFDEVRQLLNAIDRTAKRRTTAHNVVSPPALSQHVMVRAATSKSATFIAALSL